MRSLFIILICFVSPLTMADDVEEPSWELMATLGEVEVRQYAPGIQAVTKMSGSGDSTSAFRRLAGYIFGGNEREQSIAMTAPVEETLDAEGPEMAFTLPAEYALEDLPAPDDDSVVIRPVPGRTVAAIQFSGWATGGKVASKQKELLNTLAQHDVKTLGVPSLNQYNPPWTMPFLRRNEIAVLVEWDHEKAPAQ